MSFFMFDGAYKPDLAKVKAAGGIAVNGYLTGTYSTSTTQPADAIAAGLGYVPTYEQGSSELVGASRATGQAIGNRILSAFKTKRLPIDGTVAVYPSVDVNVGTGSVSSCDNGWRGMNDILAGKVSVRCYAEGAIIDHLAAAGLVDGKCWLAAPTSWPGYNANDANVCIVQEVGSSVSGTDRNHFITDPHALGAYWPDNSPYGGNDMPLTAADVAAIWDHQIVNPDTKASASSSARLLDIETDADALKAANAALTAKVDALSKIVANLALSTGMTPAQLASHLQASTTIMVKP